MPRQPTGRKKEAILDAAVVEIAGHGYHGTTVAMIARRAGVADGTIYLYFAGKEEILVSLFDRAMDRFTEQGAGELAALDDPVARLRRLIELHLELVGGDRDLAIITQV
jgi:TetR/AcrR family fatty acid metabolism transcriptional regulator